MAGLEKKSFNTPDERRTPPNTTMDTVGFGDRRVTRITYQPGWRWTTDIKPVAGSDPAKSTTLCMCSPDGRTWSWPTGPRWTSSLAMSRRSLVGTTPGSLATNRVFSSTSGGRCGHSRNRFEWGGFLEVVAAAS